jgi:large subunit ribosomal protein L13
MMPKNKIGRHMMSKLKLYSGTIHEHQAQTPIPLEAIHGRPSAAGAIYAVKPVAKPSKKFQASTATSVLEAPITETQLPPPAEAHEAQLPPPAATEPETPAATEPETPAAD